MAALAGATAAAIIVGVATAALTAASLAQRAMTSGVHDASSDEFCRALGKHCARLKRVRFQCASHFSATMRPCRLRKAP